MSATTIRPRGGKCSETTLHIHPTDDGKSRLQHYAASRRWPAAVAAAYLLESLLIRIKVHPAPAGDDPQGAAGHADTRVRRRPDVEINVRLPADEFDDLCALAGLESHAPEFVATRLLRSGVAGKLVERDLAVAVRYARRHEPTLFVLEA